MSNTGDSVQRRIGVLGGMGPQATVDFLNQVIAGTPASGDADHLRILIDNNPKVPDRQAAMRGDDSAVRAALRDMALGLEKQGADFLVMPCNTAHAFVEDAAAAVNIPLVSIIDVTAQAVSDVAPGARKVGLLATDACIAAGIYPSAAADLPFDILVPDPARQADCMRLIRAVKGGDTGDAVRAAMRSIAAALIDEGADALIAGCTEIPLVLEDDEVPVPLISSTDVLAAKAVDYGLGRLPLPVTP
ncbi:MAG: amino acid racemase [Pseudomonadota bacterium]